ncbi:dihydrodipicolinate synthase family protein [Halegenticoccus tardaugens]|uniref:dihydrodipicolinate synthase family protein n=1 Tax=Halegenticoccus tardaugens TaxID=2071624 RepID=UPI00100AF4D5|nr:dihydrodipicolinate synthase family protein [Halegenticoccus tardaugens]
MSKRIGRFGRTLCPLVTPFGDGSVSRDALESLVHHVLDGGIDGLVPCGTTGEFASLTDDEYRMVVSTTVDAAGDTPVMAGAASTSVDGTLDRIATAADVGADAALVTTPYFHTANDPAGNARFLSAIAEEAALPLYLYNIPLCTGQAIQPAIIEEVAAMESIHGMKDSSGDFTYFVEVLRRTPDDFELYQGFDSQFLAGLTHGCTGGINALANVVPEAFVAAVDAWERGDFDTALEIQTTRIVPLFEACVDHGFAPATKAALVSRGVLSDPAVRPPLVELDDAGDGFEEIEGLAASAASASD